MYLGWLSSSLPCSQLLAKVRIHHHLHHPFANLNSKAQVAHRVREDSLLPELAYNSARGINSPELEARMQREFHAWAAHFGYSFTAQRNTAEYNSFVSNARLLERVNGNESIPHWLGVNQFAHLTPQQYKDRILMQEHGQGSDRRMTLGVGSTSRQPEARQRVLQQQQLPSAVSWVQREKVTPVRNQYSTNTTSGCGSCWAFSAVAAVESAYLIAKGLNTSAAPFVNLSEEQLLQCCNSVDSLQFNNNNASCPSSSACTGGASEEAVNYITHNVLRTESIYPYVSVHLVQGSAGQCAHSRLPLRGLRLSHNAMMVLDITARSSNSKARLKQALTVGPVLVYMDASDAAFMLYTGGVYSPTPSDCSQAFTTHAMLLVGYNEAADPPYWIIKNSFGTAWGEEGYMRVSMTDDPWGACGLYGSAFQVNASFVPGFDELLGDPPPPPSPSPPPAPPPRPPMPPPNPPVRGYPASCIPGSQSGTRAFGWLVSATFSDEEMINLTPTVTRNSACERTLPDSCCNSVIQDLELLIQSRCSTLAIPTTTSVDMRPSNPRLTTSEAGTGADRLLERLRL